MIIGYNFFSLEEGTVWDTPVCTDNLDALKMDEGTYDEVFVTLDTDVVDNTAKPTFWTLSTIMDSKFTGDLDGGSIGAEGFNVTEIQLYRSVFGSNKWDAIGQFDYEKDSNLYDYVDRYVENGATYQYAIVPKANEVLGDMLISDIVESKYEGIFITDKNENRRLDYDINLGDVTYNTASAMNQPINSQHPIVTFGNSNYRTGTLSVLPLSKETVALAGNKVDKLAEQINRQNWVDFLNNGQAKVIRMDSGVLILVVTSNVIASHKTSDKLRDLASLSFNYTEIGKLDFQMMMKNNLIPNGNGQSTTFDDFGGIISG